MTRPFGLKTSMQSDTSQVDDSKTSVPESPLGEPKDGGSEQSLTAEEAKSAGIDDLSVGDRFTVEITGTVTENDPDTGIKFTVDDASDGEKTTDEPGGDEAEESDDPDTSFQAKSKIEMGPPPAMLK